VYGKYGAPTAPGTYNITATGASYATCNLCILAYDETAIYMPVADSGTITFTDYNLAAPVGTTFSGSLDMDLQEVTIDISTFETTPVVDGCTGAITGDWTGTVTDFPAK
jgi:hypothetical protein